jgi:hypothetical protein
MKANSVVPIKCEICGREGQPLSFKVCPECKRIVGRECWQPQFRKIPKDDPKFPQCKHRLQGPPRRAGVQLDP